MFHQFQYKRIIVDRIYKSGWYITERTFDELMYTMKNFDVNIDDVRGQGYDNEPKMKEKH